VTERDTVPRLGAVTPLQPGDPTRIGPYGLSGRLGAGGMGTVYLGRSPGGPAVAVKVVHPELAGDPEFRARFADEVAAARRVAPFCTARVVDADTEAARPYLVTEFVDGVPLSVTVAESGPLDPSTLHGVALGVAAALAAVHAAGVVHRDLKPANVLLSLSGPRVIDFGIARALDAAAAQHTRAGMLVGTPGWMAPEQFRGGSVGAAADVFSWGSLVAYAATGRNPWAASGPSGPSAPPAEQAERILRGTPALDGLSGQLRRLVEAALAKDPGRRPTARQLVDALLGGPAADPTRAAAGVVERTWTGLPTAAVPPRPPHAPGPRGTRAMPPGPWAPPPGPRPAQGRPPQGQPPRTRPPRGRPPQGPPQDGPPQGGPPQGRPPQGGPPQGGPPRGRPAAPTRAMPPRPPDPTRAMPPAPAPAPAPAPTAAPAAAPKRRFGLRRPETVDVTPPRPRRRRWWLRKRLLLPIGLVALAAFLAPGESTTPPASGSQLGTAVRDGQLEFVVRKVSCGVPSVGSGLVKRTAKGQFCLVDLTVTNVKGSGRQLFEPFQKLVDDGGDKHGADVTARAVYRDQDLWDKVDPGEQVSGRMVFDIPAAATPDHLELHDGPISRGVTVRLR
jgi:hypothetical protein